MSEDRSHFTMIPYLIDDLDLDVYQFRVYCAIKRCAGEDGKCIMSLDKIAAKIKISRTKLKSVINSLCEKHPKVGKPLLLKKNRLSEHGDKDTNIIIVNDIWKDNSLIFKKQSGRSPDDPPRSPDDQGVGHHVTEGRSPRDHKEELLKKNYMKKTTTPTSSFSAESVDKSQSSSLKEAEKEAARSTKNWIDNEAIIERERRVGNKKNGFHKEKVEWGKQWIIPFKVYERIFHTYGISYARDHFDEMVRQQKDLDLGIGKGIDKPEVWINLACEKNWANSENRKDKK